VNIQFDTAGYHDIGNHFNISYGDWSNHESSNGDGNTVGDTVLADKLGTASSADRKFIMGQHLLTTF
jgi:hypothetical protein